MSHSVRSHLRLEIAEYDAIIRRFIPEYDTMLAVAADAVAAIRPAHVVDLGAGTGALSAELLSRGAIGVVELLDVDREMMAQARARLADFGDRVVFTLRSYNERFGSCDAFTASLSLHHIPTIEQKARLFQNAFDALRPGGVLVNADATMPTDPVERDRLWRFWADHLVGEGIPEARAWKHFEEWAGEDTYLPLETELEALRGVGFHADRIWAVGPIGVVVAAKPPGSVA